MPWGVKTRLRHEKTAIGFYLSGHLFDKVELEVRKFAECKIEDRIDSRDQQLIAAIVTDLRVINGQRGKLALFKLDDKTAVIEATADEGVLNANRNTLNDDELLIIQGVLQPDRFAGGFRLKVTQVWGREASEQGDLLLGLSVRLGREAAKFYPTDTALAGRMAQADSELVQVVYE